MGKFSTFFYATLLATNAYGFIEPQAALEQFSEEANGEFWDRELYSSSKKGKGKAGSKKSGKSGKGKAGSKKGSSRRELESLMQDLEMAHDTDFFDANDKDAEYQFFDREL